MANVDGASQSLYADLTCSLCLSIYDRPKMMPNCPHTFCLECLEGLVRANNSRSILCPECRVRNQMPVKLACLAANLVVQNVAEKMRRQKEITDSTQAAEAATCPHFLFGEKRELCPHCNKPFCDSCKYRHVANLEKEISANVDTMSALSLPQVSTLEKKLADRFKQDEKEIVEQAEKVKAKINDMVSAKLAEVLNARQNFQAQTLEQIKALLAKHNAAVNSVGCLKNRQKGSNYDLAYVAKAYSEMAAAMNSFEKVQTISNLSKSAVITLTTGSVFDDFLHKLSSSNDAAALRIGQQLADILPNVTNKTVQQLTPVPTAKANAKQQTAEKLTISESGFRQLCSLEMFARAVGEVTSPRSDFCHPRLVRPDIDACCKQIVAFPTQGEFAVLLKFHSQHVPDTVVWFYKANGDVSENASCLLSRPSYASSMTVYEIATDYRRTIYFTARVKLYDGTTFKQICRVWRTSNNTSDTDAFVTSELNTSFYGLAISEKLGLVFTTVEESIVAYESINNPRGLSGREVGRWYFGPRPSLIGVNDVFTNRAVRVIGKTEGRAQILTIDDVCYSSNSRLSYYMDGNGNEQDLLNYPEHVGYFYDGAVFYKGSSFYKVNKTVHPAVVGSFRTDFSGLVDVEDAATVKSVCVLKPARNDENNDELYIGVVYHSNQYVFAKLIWN